MEDAPGPSEDREKQTATQPCLQWRDLDGRQQFFALAEEEVVVGRKADAQIVLDNQYISRHHAKIIKTEQGYAVVDLGSAFGTYVNELRVEQPVLLRHGDHIVLGKDHLTLFYFTGDADFPAALHDAETNILEKSISDLAQVLPSELSDLEKISFLLDFQYQWGQVFTPEKTFQQILESALKISGAERGFILLRKEEFEYAVGVDRRGRKLPPVAFQTSQSVVAQVVADGSAVFMAEGIRGKFAEQASILAMNLRAIACLPLHGISSRGDSPNLSGILYLDSTRTMHTLSGLDEKILTKLAEEAGNVLEKVEMIKTFEERKKLEQELTLAEEMQKSLLPQSLPVWENFRLHAFSKPTRQVGGDLYNFFSAGSGEMGGILADVAGKGFAAALLSSMLLGCLDMQVRAGTGPAEALNQLNLYLCEKHASNCFATLFLFVVNPAGAGQYISAGHNPAYLFRSATGRIEEVASNNLLLGAFDFVSYQSAPLQLNRGDVLVVYSDGLMDAEDPDGEMLGEERVKEVIVNEALSGAGRLAAKLLQTISEFTRGHPQTDDITLLILERTG